MEEKIDDWEDRICQGFRHMVQVQDQETGECWTVAKDADCSAAGSDSKTICTRIRQTVGGWKVPKEYSLLGANFSFQGESIQPVFATVI